MTEALPEADLVAVRPEADNPEARLSRGALAWSLRIATSAARMAKEAGGVAAARAELRAVLDRFTEGHDTADYREALAVLDQLGQQ